MASSTATPPTSFSTLAAKEVKIRELESALVAFAQERSPEFYAGVFKELQIKLQDAARELQAKARELVALKQNHATDRAWLLKSNAVAMRELEEDLERHKTLSDEIQAVNAQKQLAIAKLQEDQQMQDAKCKKLNTRVKGLVTTLVTERQHVSQLERSNARLVADAKTVEVRLAAVCAEKANSDRCVTDQARDLCAAKIALELERASAATLQTEYEEVRQALPALREDYEANASELQRLRQKLDDTATLHRDLADARAEAAARTTERDEALVLSGLALRERDVLSRRLAAVQSERQAYHEARKSYGGPLATATVMGLNDELAARDRMIQSLKDAKQSFIARYAALQAQKTQLQREREELSRDVDAAKSKLQAVVADRDEAVHSLKIARDQVHAVVKERDRASDETMEMRKACKAAVTMIQTHRFAAHLALQLRSSLQKHLPLPLPPETIHPTTGKGMHAQWLLENFRTLLFNFDEVLHSFERQHAKTQEVVNREHAYEAVKRVEVALTRCKGLLEDPRLPEYPYGSCLSILEAEKKKIPIDCGVARRVLEAFHKAVDCLNDAGDLELRLTCLQNGYNLVKKERDTKARELRSMRDSATRFEEISFAFKEHADNVPSMIIRPLYQLAAHATAATVATAGLESQTARTRAVEDEIANLQLAAGCWEEQTNLLTAQLDALKSELTRPTPMTPASQYSWTPVKRPRDPASGGTLSPTKRRRLES